MKQKIKVLCLICVLIPLLLFIHGRGFTKIKYKKVSRSGFHVQYDPLNTESEIQEVISLFIKSRKELAGIFHLEFERDSAITIYGTVLDFIQNTDSPGWLGARFLNDEFHLQPVRILKEKGLLKTTIYHESAHYYMNRMTNENCPLWLNEGFAVYFSGELQLLKPHVPQKIQGFTQLSKSLKNAKTRAEAVNYYSISGFLVFRLLSQYGQKKFLKLLSELRSGKTFSSASLRAYLLTKKQLFKNLTRP